MGTMDSVKYKQSTSKYTAISDHRGNSRSFKPFLVAKETSVPGTLFTPPILRSPAQATPRAPSGVC